MLKKFALFLLFLTLFIPAFAAKLVNFSVYDREDRVDLMLSFDAPYNGHISQMKQGNIIAISLNDLLTDKAQSQNLSKGIVKKVLITPQNNKTAIALETSSQANINISSINNKIGLRIRILNANAGGANSNSAGNVQNSGANSNMAANSNTNLNTAPNQGFLASPNTLAHPNATNSSANSQNSPATNQANSGTNLNPQTNSQTPVPQGKNSSLDGFDLKNYILVLIFLLAILIFLWWFKKRLAKNYHFDSKDFKIIFQRALDKNNQFMILEYEQKRFVLIVGSSNTLLEVKDAPLQNFTSNKQENFTQTKVQSSVKNASFERAQNASSKNSKEKSFDNFFEENRQKIQRLIQKNS